jgi:hypothetical protein
MIIGWILDTEDLFRTWKQSILEQMKSAELGEKRATIKSTAGEILSRQI